ncbi:MAG: 16S rRNA (adenine(1518)-N(6)/adenine(1519)-N(6))-dimethyltransferase RsmA [Gammaproteobacteria bacterium]|nr:16S rRNA (adenine(1518)-N(6)/adenine(1519)-N(6))-dimethyltransferase RsmA [Gammaproteobacteria bacterium]
MSHQPRKRFGQHFLHDPNVINGIISAIHPVPGQTMVEIGPGLGAMTCPLLSKIENLQVVELDRDVIPILKDNCAGKGELTIHQADALRFDFNQLSELPRSLRVVGNLPYNISTPLIFHLLETADKILDMHFLLQKEVVERLAAKPGGGDYGRLSVMVQYRCKAENLFHVGRGAFNPPPKVESAVVRLTPYKTLPHVAKDEGLFAQIVNQAFSQRRKTLRKALQKLCSDEDFANTGIDSSLRPEHLSVADFVQLSNQVTMRQDS